MKYYTGHPSPCTSLPISGKTTEKFDLLIVEKGRTDQKYTWRSSQMYLNLQGGPVELMLFYTALQFEKISSNGPPYVTLWHLDISLTGAPCIQLETRVVPSSHYIVS